MTSYSWSATPISYKDDEISRVSRSFRDLTQARQTTDAATETEGSHTTLSVRA